MECILCRYILLFYTRFCRLGLQLTIIIIIIIITKRISRAPIYHARCEHRALYNNTNDRQTDTHTHTHTRTHAHTHTHTHRTHTHTHTHIYIYIYTDTCASRQRDNICNMIMLYSVSSSSC